MYINREIEMFLRESGMAATKLGRLAVSDPRLVLDMRRGRELRPSTQIRVRQFIAGYRAGRKSSNAA